MIDLRPRRSQKSLREILEIPEPFRFLEALIDLAVPPGTAFKRLEKRSELCQMIVVFNGIFIYVGNDGIWKYLIENDATKRFARAQGWLQKVGAHRTSDYFSAVVLAFPNGSIPSNDGKRADLLLNSNEVSHKLRELDRAYKPTLDEMVECLRSHIRGNFDQFRLELENANDRSAPTRWSWSFWKEKLKQMIKS